MGGIQELATTTAGPHQGHELGLGSSNDPCVCGSALVVTVNKVRNELNMIQKQFIAACALMLLVLATAAIRATSMFARCQPLIPSNRLQTCLSNCISAIGRVRLAKGVVSTLRLLITCVGLTKSNLGNAGDLPTPMASGTQGFEIDSMQLGLTTATRSKLTHDFLTGPARHAEERSSGGSQPTVARSLAGSNERVSNTLQSSTTTIRADSN